MEGSGIVGDFLDMPGHHTDLLQFRGYYARHRLEMLNASIEALREIAHEFLVERFAVQKVLFGIVHGGETRIGESNLKCFQNSQPITSRDVGEMVICVFLKQIIEVRTQTLIYVGWKC